MYGASVFRFICLCNAVTQFVLVVIAHVMYIGKLALINQCFSVFFIKSLVVFVLFLKKRLMGASFKYEINSKFLQLGNKHKKYNVDLITFVMSAQNNMDTLINYFMLTSFPRRKPSSLIPIQYLNILTYIALHNIVRPDIASKRILIIYQQRTVTATSQHIYYQLNFHFIGL